ncbi:uncharacterized protein LOC116295591, partial [Actinia tenebrosa]|uniref:Uncharacterized protein LOC116295591 n=1 Tax=Actinia tenebrosa TaxID=6105 RepID=A0A6P8HSE6_ACTTE
MQELPQPVLPEPVQMQEGQGTPNTEVANQPYEKGARWLKCATVIVCIVNFFYIVGIAVLIGILKGWYYSIHCFIISLLCLLSFVSTVKAKTKLEIKIACWLSCSNLVLVLMTSFTLLTRQAYYHSSHLFDAKWVVFSLQASIIPLLAGILVMYECSIKELYKDRFILMRAVLDFADIWEMASYLSQNKPPFLKEESPLEIAMQFFCSSSFTVFSLLIYKNITHEALKLVFKNKDQPASQQDKVNHVLVQNYLQSYYSKVAIQTSQFYQ